MQIITNYSYTPANNANLRNLNQNTPSKTSYNIASVLYKYQNAGLKPVSFGASPANVFIQEIAEKLFTHRRPLSLNEPPEALEVFTSIWTPKLENYVKQGKPVEMIIAAFPFKSLSRNKCVSEHADMAETTCIKYLDNMLDEIKKVYEPGGRLHIFSDGYIFSSIEGNPTDSSTALYAKELKEIIRNNNSDGTIQMHTLTDLFGEDYITSRNKIFSEHGQTVEQIRERVLYDPVLANDYCGIKRFVYEELGGIEQYADLTNTRRQKLSKRLAYETVQASEAWTSFLQGAMPESLRLSCHPQNYDSPNKIGIWLGKSKDNWLTPWMGVAVKTGEDNYTLMQNLQAKELGLKLVRNNKGIPSYYEIPEGKNIGDLLNINR